MADRQYTFRTTRDTEWLEPILDGITSDRSALIRELIISGLEVNGVSTDYAHAGSKKRYALSKLDNLSHDVRENVRETSHINERKPRQTLGAPIEEPGNLFEVKESEVKDLDSALDSLDFDKLTFE